MKKTKCVICGEATYCPTCLVGTDPTIKGCIDGMARGKNWERLQLELKEIRLKARLYDKKCRANARLNNILELIDPDIVEEAIEKLKEKEND